MIEECFVVNIRLLENGNYVFPDKKLCKHDQKLGIAYMIINLFRKSFMSLALKPYM